MRNIGISLPLSTCFITKKINRKTLGKALKKLGLMAENTILAHNVILMILFNTKSKPERRLSTTPTLAHKKN